MSNGAIPAIDPFGVGDDVSRDMAALEEQGGDGDVLEPGVVAQKRLGPGGIPMPAFIGISAFAVFMLVVISVVIIAKMSGGDGGRQAAMRAEEARRTALEASQQGALRAQLEESQSAIKALQDSQTAMSLQLKKALATQDVQAVEQRVGRVETAIRQLGVDVATVTKRIGDSQPFEAEMYARDDLHIVSIGNGIARVVDKSGHEFSLHRGDHWDGLRVLRIRADRRQLIFSDGSVVS